MTVSPWTYEPDREREVRARVRSLAARTALYEVLTLHPLTSRVAVESHEDPADAESYGGTLYTEELTAERLRLRARMRVEKTDPGDVTHGDYVSTAGPDGPWAGPVGWVMEVPGRGHLIVPMEASRPYVDVRYGRSLHTLRSEG